MNTKDFASTMQNDPKQIIAWCRKEIKLYEELIDILEPKKLGWVILTYLPKGVIHSVRRLSDNQIFTVGDKYSNNESGIFTKETIERFYIDNDQLRVESVENNGYYHIEDIELLSPKSVTIKLKRGDKTFTVTKTKK